MPRFSLTRSTTLRVAGAVAALAVTAPLPQQAGAVGDVAKVNCRKAGLVTGGVSEWQSFTAPTFSTPVGVDPPSQDVAAYAVGSTNPALQAVTNGNSIYVTRDHGCSWYLALRLDRTPSDVSKVPLSGVLTTIRSLYIAPRTNALFALAEEADVATGVGRPHVLRSTNNGTSWEVTDSGLPPIGKPLQLRGLASNGNVLYVTFSGAREEAAPTGCPPAPLPCDSTVSGRRLGLMYASVDGGRSWGARTDPGDLNSAAEIKYFSIDDDDPSGSTVWVVANGELRRSTNGGRSYVSPDGLNQRDFGFTVVETLNRGDTSSALSLVAFSNHGEMIRLDRGRWIRSRVPFLPVESVAQRPEGDIAVATTPIAGNGVSVFRIFPKDFNDFEYGGGLAGTTFKSTYGWENITPNTALRVPARITGGDAGSRAAGTFFARDKRRVLRFLHSRARLPQTSAPPANVSAPPPPVGRITPQNITLDIPVGKTRTIDYTLTMPPAPTPLDVYLLLDNSVSMLPVIDDLKKNLAKIARSLVASGVDVNMGVGKFNVQVGENGLPVDDPRTTSVDESKPQPLYERLRAIGKVDGELFRQLSTVRGDAGIGHEPQLEALWQSVTGRGLQADEVGLFGYTIKPGQNAGFRDPLEPIKVIVHATNEEFSTDIRGGHNEPAEVGKALFDANVRQIGLSQGNPDAKRDLEDMARRTGAVAPPGGTDCDGDGDIDYDDVPAGRPLVCGQSEGLDKTLVNLLQSLSDRQVIGLRSSRTPTVDAVSRTSFAIDAKQATSVKFSVTYTCANIAPGQYVSDLNASLRGVTIAKAVATVNCGGLTVPPKPPLQGGVNEPGTNPPPPQPQAVAPAPVPVNPVPQPQTQVQTQVNPQAGMADQEQDQVQVATAEQQQEEERGDADQLAMSRLSYDDAPGMVLVPGLVMAAAFGVALRRRTRTAQATAAARR